MKQITRQRLPFILTGVLGVVGAFVGGYLAGVLGLNASVTGFNIPSMITAILGACVVLGVYGLIARRRG